MTEDVYQRTVGDLTIRIDPTLCVAFNDCIEIAPDAFRLDDEDVVAFVNPDAVAPERLLSACDACPVDALTVLRADGTQLVP